MFRIWRYFYSIKCNYMSCQMVTGWTYSKWSSDDLGKSFPWYFSFHHTDSPFSGPSDVAEGVDGQIKLGAGADDGRADLLVVAVPHELHPHDVGIRSPLREKKAITIKSEGRAVRDLKNINIFRVGRSQARWSCDCSSSTFLVSPEDKTGSSCGNQTPSLLWFLLQNQ